MLIKITKNVLKYTILIYPSYNLKDELLIKTSNLVFIFKTDNIEEGLLQLLNIEFSLIFNVTTITNNNEINDIS
jgi:hypothetical protein